MCHLLAEAALTAGILKHLCFSHAHADASVLKQTVKQHGIRVTGEFISYSACLRTKRQWGCTPRCATRPLDQVRIYTAGLYTASLGRSRYVAVFLYSVSHLQWPYGALEKSAPDTVAVAKHFVEDTVFHVSFGQTTRWSTRTGCSWTTTSVSASSATSPHRTPHNRTAFTAGHISFHR